MVAMATSHWPLFDLRLATERLVLRPVTDDDMDDVVAAIDAGVHDPTTSPFMFQWTDAEPVVRARNALQFLWSHRANWKVDDWSLGLGVFFEGRFVGIQDVEAKQFLTLREVSTGSWLTQSAQGQGIGKEMRAAVLCLAFDYLGAEVANTAAFVTNPASQGETRFVGYEENGRHRVLNRGEPVEAIRFRLTREAWAARGLPAARVENLAPCLDMFGL